MVLDRLDAQIAVSDTHDDARFLRSRSDNELGREGGDGSGEGVVSSGIEQRVEIMEDALRVVLDFRGLAVLDLSCERDLPSDLVSVQNTRITTHLSSKDVDNTFQAHADAQDGDFAHPPPDHIARDARVGCGVAGARGDDYPVKVAVIVHGLRVSFGV